jgi:transmembrane sensor
MKKEDFLIILGKYNQGTATQEEEGFLFAYYRLFDLEEDVLDKLDAESKQFLKNSIKMEIDRQAQFSEGIEFSEAQASAGNNYIPWLAAAMFLLLSSLGYLLYNRSPEKMTDNQVTVQKKEAKIVPGTNQALLTLENGEVIVLNNQVNGVVSQQSGVSVSKLKDGQLVYEMKETLTDKPVVNTVSTPNGGQYQLMLADGSKAWLNAASSIKFPSVFAEHERVVEITGEVYFEVAPDPLKPFKVRSDNQLIEVLGTRFNVNTYRDEPSSKTTLIEGKVSISKLMGQGRQDRSGSRIMKPGQQASVDKDSPDIRLEIVDTEQSVAWKNGYFKFDRADIQTVMRQICRWYDVEAEFKGKVSADLFAGEIKRDEDVNKVLRIFQLSNMDVQIKGRKIIISN